MARISDPVESASSLKPKYARAIGVFFHNVFSRARAVPGAFADPPPCVVSLSCVPV